MFAIEIDFRDGVSAPETILVRRAQATVGGGENSHVVIEGVSSAGEEYRLVRGLGRSFDLICYNLQSEEEESLQHCEEEGELVFGSTVCRLTALDVDLLFSQDESLDRAGIRVLRAAFRDSAPKFPAVALLGSSPTIVSFSSKQSILIGRSRKCLLRIDSSEVSSEHARVGFSEGRFWVEDIGSTNGTFVSERRISGRQILNREDVITVGNNCRLVLVADQNDLAMVPGSVSQLTEKKTELKYPCILSRHPAVRPSVYPIRAGLTLTIGRDPACDIWINAQHISRRHLLIKWDGDHGVELTDRSSNGTLVNGKTVSLEEVNKFYKENLQIDFGNDIKLLLMLSTIVESETDVDEKTAISSGVQRESVESEQVKLPESTKIEEGGVFKRLVERKHSAKQSVNNKKQEYFENKSKNSASEVSEIIEQGITSTALQVVDEQKSKSISHAVTAQQEPIVSGEFDLETDYSLLEGAEFNEDLLETPQIKTFGRLLIIGLITSVVSIIILLLISIFRGAH